MEMLDSRIPQVSLVRTSILLTSSNGIDTVRLRDFSFCICKTFRVQVTKCAYIQLVALGPLAVRGHVVRSTKQRSADLGQAVLTHRTRQTRVRALCTRKPSLQNLIIKAGLGGSRHLQ